MVGSIIGACAIVTPLAVDTQKPKKGQRLRMHLNPAIAAPLLNTIFSVLSSCNSCTETCSANSHEC